MNMEIEHVPVLLAEVMAGLHVKSDGQYIDATTGAGGHSRAILQASAPAGRLLCIDTDPHALARARQKLADFVTRTCFVVANFSELEAVAIANGFSQVNGILFDLGVSSLQLNNATRGISFQHEGPLDMRLSGQGPTAADLINNLPEEELAALIWKYGEERHARRIARAISAARPLHSTLELAQLVARVKGQRGKINPATQTFQALRIAVNRELEVLEAALPQAVRLLASGGRLVIISFHSLEDRIVKTFFRQESRDCICPPEVLACTCEHRASLRLLHKKVITPSDQERVQNPRSRSAKLRIAERL